MASIEHILAINIQISALNFTSDNWNIYATNELLIIQKKNLGRKILIW